MESIVLAKDFDISKISYGSVKTLESGGRSIYVAYNGRPLIMQTPELTAPFGITKWSGDGKAPDKFTLELSLKGRDERENVRRFYDVLEELDTKIVQDAMENSMSWLKKKYTSTEVVQALYTPMIKYAKDKNTGEITDKYPPTFRLSLPHKDGKFSCEVYDKNRELMDLQALETTKGCRMTAICQATGIWVAGGKFGCSWKVVQLLCIPHSSIRGFAFKMDDKPALESPILSEAGSEDGDEDAVVSATQPTAAVLEDPEEDDDEDIVEDDDPIDRVPPPETKTVTVPKSTIKSAGAKSTKK